MKSYNHLDKCKFVSSTSSVVEENASEEEVKIQAAVGNEPVVVVVESVLEEIVATLSLSLLSRVMVVEDDVF